MQKRREFRPYFRWGVISKPAAKQRAKLVVKRSRGIQRSNNLNQLHVLRQRDQPDDRLHRVEAQFAVPVNTDKRQSSLHEENEDFKGNQDII